VALALRVLLLCGLYLAVAFGALWVNTREFATGETADLDEVLLKAHGGVSTILRERYRQDVAVAQRLAETAGTGDAPLSSLAPPMEGVVVAVLDPTGLITATAGDLAGAPALAKSLEIGAMPKNLPGGANPKPAPTWGVFGPTGIEFSGVVHCLTTTGTPGCSGKGAVLVARAMGEAGVLPLAHAVGTDVALATPQALIASSLDHGLVGAVFQQAAGAPFDFGPTSISMTGGMFKFANHRGQFFEMPETGVRILISVSTEAATRDADEFLRNGFIFVMAGLLFIVVGIVLSVDFVSRGLQYTLDAIAKMSNGDFGVPSPPGWLFGQPAVVAQNLFALAGKLKDGQTALSAKLGAQERARGLTEALQAPPRRPTSTGNFKVPAGVQGAAPAAGSGPKATPPGPTPIAEQIQQTVPAMLDDAGRVSSGEKLFDQLPDDFMAGLSNKSAPSQPPVPQSPDMRPATVPADLSAVSSESLPPLRGATAPGVAALSDDHDEPEDRGEVTSVGRAPTGVLDQAKASVQTMDPFELHARGVFDDFLAIRRRTGEPTAGLSFDKFFDKLKKNRDELLQQKPGTRDVTFEAYEKNGKAALKATPVK
jgi:hypothetical protein